MSNTALIMSTVLLAVLAVYCTAVIVLAVRVFFDWLHVSRAREAAFLAATLAAFAGGCAGGSVGLPSPGDEWWKHRIAAFDADPAHANWKTRLWFYP